MKRRSVKVRYIFFALFVLLLTLALTTRVLVPLDEFLLGQGARFLLGYYSLTGEQKDATGARSEVHVVSKLSNEFSQTIIINTHASLGAEVVSGDALVGFVTSSTENASKVEFIASPGRKIDSVLVRSGIPLALQGRGASILTAQLPKGSDVHVGDEVYYDPGRSMRIGTVARIDEGESDPFIIVVVLTSVNPTTLQDVEIVLPK